MDKVRPRAMDVTAAPRQNQGMPKRRAPRMSRRMIIGAVAAAVVLVAAIIGWYVYQHRNDQRVLRDRYQAVYLVTGQVYIGKLQNTTGQYLTLTHVFTLQSPQGDTSKTDNTSNLVQVSRQVYGPDDSMAIRADQVQFWQNLRSDSKVSQAIQSAGQSQ